MSRSRDWRRAQAKRTERPPPPLPTYSAPTARQLRYLQQLSEAAGVPSPFVRTRWDASREIERLKPKQ
jgi:hypothetical protein